jgi:hypothetical protein
MLVTRSARSAWRALDVTAISGRQQRAITVWHLLVDPDAVFCDLGPGHYESQINKERRAHNLATQLQTLTGQKIIIRDGKAVIVESEVA